MEQDTLALFAPKTNDPTDPRYHQPEQTSLNPKQTQWSLSSQNDAPATSFDNANLLHPSSHPFQIYSHSPHSSTFLEPTDLEVPWNTAVYETFQQSEGPPQNFSVDYHPQIHSPEKRRQKESDPTLTPAMLGEVPAEQARPGPFIDVLHDHGRIKATSDPSLAIHPSFLSANYVGIVPSLVHNQAQAPPVSAPAIPPPANITPPVTPMDTKSNVDVGPSCSIQPSIVQPALVCMHPAPTNNRPILQGPTNPISMLVEGLPTPIAPPKPFTPVTQTDHFALQLAQIVAELALLPQQARVHVSDTLEDHQHPQHQGASDPSDESRTAPIIIPNPLAVHNMAMTLVSGPQHLVPPLSSLLNHAFSATMPRSSGIPTNVEVPEDGSVDNATLKRLRNRISASRCRQKKRVLAAGMDRGCSQLTILRTEVEKYAMALEEERDMLLSLMMTARVPASNS